MSVYYITNNSIDNFNSIGQLEYVGIENKVLTEKELIEQNKVELYKDTTIFINDFPFNGYPIRIGTTIRPATVVELIKLNLQDLKDGEYIEGDELKEVQKPSYRHNIWDKNTRTWLLNEHLLKDGEYVENGEIKSVHRPEEMFKPVWNKELHIWEESASENEIKLYKAQEQFKEYKSLDTPLSFELMEEQGVLFEYKTMMKDLCKVIDTLESPVLLKVEDREVKVIELPVPSEALVEFKNKFNRFFK